MNDPRADASEEAVHYEADEHNGISAAAFEQLAEESPAGLALLDAQPPYRVLACNRAYQRCWPEPFRTEGVKGHFLSELAPVTRETNLWEIFQEAARSRRAKSFHDFPCFSGPGILSWWDWSVSPLEHEGKLIAFSHTIIDITAQVNEKRRLDAGTRGADAGEGMLAATLDHLQQGVLIFEPTGTLRHINRAALRMLRFESPEQAPTQLAEFDLIFAASSTNGKTIPALQWPVNRAMHGEAVSDLELELRHRETGRSFIGLFSALPVRTPSGAIRFVALTISDITGRKLTDQALRESELSMRQMIDWLPALVWTARPNGYCDFFSRQWVEYTGIAGEQQLGSQWLDAVHPEDRERARLAWETAVRGRQDYDVEYRLRRNDGEYRWFKTRARALRDERGEVTRWFGQCVDITERKDAEDALMVADRRKDDFIALLAHELRDPLSSIAAAESLLSTPNISPAHDEQAREALRTHTRQLSRMLDDLLDVSRIARGKVELELQAVPIASVIAKAAESARALIEQRKHLVSVHIEEQIYAWADPLRLEQIIAHLLSNAARYTPEGGQISVSATSEGDMAVLKVRDTGIGIPGEAQAKIFDLFGQTHKSFNHAGGGLGIGLYLVKRLVQMHNGSVSVHSEGADKGSEFEVRIPLAPQTAVEELEGQATRPGVEVLNMLLVEDNRDTATFIAALLEMDGHTVRVAYDGTEGLRLALELHPEVILLDLGLPGMNGYEVARTLRDQGLQDTLIIAVSGYGQRRDIERSKEAGINYHLLKPMDYASLSAILAEWRQRARQEEKMHGRTH